MKFFVLSQNVPLGYTTPKFPALYWPIALGNANLAYLYYTKDIWSFTVYWSVIAFVIAYTLVGLGSAVNMVLRRFRKFSLAARPSLFDIKPLYVFAVYVLLGVVHGVAAGTITGAVLLLLYTAGSLAMTTWIPFSWGMAMILYHICASYSTSLLLI